jgi:autotransporter-associated beta strand protein
MTSRKSTLRRLARSTFCRGAALAALATAITAPTLRAAATGDWNIDNNGTTGWGTSSNWLGGTVPNAIDDVANFGFNLTAARTINLDGSRVLGAMTVGDPATAFFGYTFSANGQGGALIFDTTGANAGLTFTAAPGGTVNTFNVPLQLNDNLDVHTLNTGQNAFNGNITGTGALTFDSGGTHSSGASSLVGQVILNGVNTFSGGLTAGTGARVNVSNPYALGTGAVTVNDGGQVYLATAGIYSSNFTLNGFGWNEPTQAQLGALRSDSNSTLTGSITLAGNSRLVGTGGTTLINGVISDSGAGWNLEINRLQTGGAAAAATFVLNNTSTYTGKTTVYSGTLRIGDGGTTGSLGATSGVEFANANLEFRRSDNVTITTLFTQLTGTIGGVAVTGSNFVHSGAGVLTLDNGASGYTGTTTVNGVNAFGNAGKLVIGTGGAYAFGTAGTSAGAITLSNGADLEFNTSSAVTLAGALTGATNSYLIQSGSGTTTLGGTGDNANGRAIVNNGTLVLAKLTNNASKALGSSNELALIVNGGTAQIAGDQGNQIHTASDVQINGGTLDLNGRIEGFDLLTGNGGAVTNTAATAGTLILGEANSNIGLHNGSYYSSTYGGAIQDGAGTVALTKTGTGLQTLSGASTYTGATTINGGTLSITGSLATAGAVAVNGTGTLSGTGSVGNVTLATGGAIRPGATNLDLATGTLTMSSLVVNGGDLRMNLGASSDLVSVTGAANFAAASTITPTFSAPPAVGTIPLITAAGGLTLGVSPTLTGIPATTRSTFALIPSGNSLILDVSGASAKSLTWTGANSAVWNLNTTANFNGGGVETFYNLDAVTFGDGANNRIVTLAAGLNPSAVTVNNSTGNDYTFLTGTIVGGATSVAKSGNGTLFLNTANTFSGAVTITGGTLKAGNAAALGDAIGQTFVSGGGTLDVNGLNLGAEVIKISGSGVGGNGAIINSGAQQLNATRFITLTGDATIGASANRFDIRANGGGEILDLAGFTLTKTGAGTFGIVNALVSNGNIAVTQGGLQIEGATGIVQGTGTITLSAGTTATFYQTVAANVTRPMTWNGITIDTLAQNSGVGSNITLGGDATFVATGNTLTLIGNLSETGGARSLIKNNAGTLTLNGNNTFTGGITATGGVLNLGGTNTTAGPVSITGSTLQVVSTPTVNATLGNVPSITLNSTPAAAGTLRLNLLNSYTLPAVTLGGTNPTNVIHYAGQTQATNLTVNSTIGSAANFLNLFNVESGNATLASGANITANSTTVGRTALASGNIGTLNIQPGSTLTTSILYLGEGSGFSGIVNQTGGTVSVTAADNGADGSLRIGHFPGTGATYNLSGGTLNVPNGVTGLGIDGNNPSFNISGGTANLYRLVVDARNGATPPIGGTLNLSGGELAIGGGGLVTSPNGQTNLSGGTLSAYAPATFSGGMNFVNNTPTIDTRGNPVTASGPLNGPGGFTKIGNSRLTLSSPTSFAGGTINASAGETYLSGSLLNPTATVNVASGATLTLDGSGANTGIINGTVNVNNGAVLSGSGNGTATGKVGTVNIAAGGEVRPGSGSGISTLAANNFAMNGGNARFDLNGTATTTGGGVNDLIAVTGALTFTGGTVTPSFSSAPVSGNVYTLFTSGALTGLPAVDPNAAVSRLAYALGASGNNVTLTVTGATKALTWTGANGSTWNLNSTQNFNDATLAPEKFLQQDSVTFDGATPGTITLTGVLQPSSITVNSSSDYTFAGPGSIDSGTLTKTGAGTLTLTGTNSYAGGTTITGGTVSFANGALGTGPITMNGGTLKWDGANTQDVSQRVAMVPATTASFDTNGNTVTFNAPVGGGTSGALTKMGTGTLILNGANTYTGATTVSSGTLSVGNGSNIGSLAAGSAVSVGPGATMKWNNNNSTTNLTVANPISGAGTVLLQGQNDISGGLQVSLYDLSGANSGFTGTLQINRAMLWNTVTPAEIGSAAIDIQDRGTMTFSGNTFANNITIGQGAGWHHNVGGVDAVIGAIRLEGASNTLTGNIVLNNMASIVLGDNTGANSTIAAYGGTTSNNLLTGVISGPGDFAMSRYSSAGGTATLVRLGGTASNTYTGKTVVDGQAGNASLWLEKTGGAVAIPGNTIVQFGSGTTGQANLRMGQSEQFGPGVVMNWVNASGQWGRFDLKGTTQTVAGLNAGTLTVQGGAVIQNQGLDVVVPTAPGLLTLTGSGTYLYNGYIRNADNGSTTAPALALTKTGSGTQTLAGVQITYTGNTIVSGGTLILDNTTAFNSSIDNSATVQIVAAAGSNYTLGTGKTYSGNGNWIKSGDGRVRILNGTWTTSGNIFVQGGILQNDNNAANWSGSTANLDVSAGATLDLFADSIRGNMLSGAGTVTNGYGVGNGIFDTLTVGVSGGSSHFSGPITDGGAGVAVGRGGLAFTKEGTGTQTLSGTNTYSGPTTISNGTLQVGNGGTTGTLGTNAVINNGSLVVNRAGTITMNNTISGTGSLIKNGTGKLVLNAGNTYTGATVITAGTVQLGASSTLPVSSAVWLDATDGSTINTSGSGVTSWTNKGTLGALGNTTAPIGAEPSLVTAEPAMNNQPVIHFDAAAGGTGPFDQLTNGLNFSASDVTILYAGRLTGGANFRLFSGLTNNYLLGTWAGSSDRAHLGQGSAFVDQNGVAANTNPHIYTGINSAAGLAAFYSDTVLKGMITNAAIYSGPNGISLGGGAGSPTGATTEFSDGDIGEVLVFTSVLSEEERRSVEAYLARKWQGVGNSNVLSPTTSVSLTNSGATLDLNGVTQTVGSVSGAPGTNILLGGGTLNTGGDHSSTSFAGVLSGTGTVIKSGTGTWTLGGASTNLGNVTVNGGTLNVNGSLTGSSLSVATGATLSGDGTITGDVSALSGATIAPGTTIGQLDTGNFTLNSGATLSLEIGGVTAGTQYDQLNVTGNVTLGGNLSLSLLGGFTPAPGQKFWAVLNDTNADAVSGFFANVPVTDVGNHSGVFTSGDIEWTVYYGADFGASSTTGGNDILLTVPEPGTVGAMLAGLGLLLGLRRRRA